MDFEKTGRWLCVLCVCVLFVSACLDTEAEEAEEEGGSDLSTASEECLSGTAWVGGEIESPRMHPGLDCLSCHQSLGEAQEVTLAGTVYDGADEADDCFGVEGVTLQITDANGDVIEVDSNSAGNFVLENVAIATPYSAKLLYEGRERAMVAMQTETSCNACHTQTGANGAPGRILAP
jgi:hypothetical protein